MVHVRDKKGGDGWMESKHAMAFHSSDVHYYKSKDGSETNHRILNREFVGYIGAASDFKYHFLSLAKRNQCDLCSEVVVISDGASWIHSIVKNFFQKRPISSTCSMQRRMPVNLHRLSCVASSKRKLSQINYVAL